MSDLTEQIRRAEPRLTASADARERARNAALSGLASAPRRRWMPWQGARGVALAGVGALATAGALAVAFVLVHGSDQPARLVLPGDNAPPASPSGPSTTTKAGIAATIIFRPAAGVSQDDAYAQMVRVIKARAARQKGVRADVRRADRDEALVTLTGIREPITLSDAVAGSSVAVYDLDQVLVGTFTSFRKAVLRARALAPGAPSSLAYLFRNGRLVRGPAPSEAELRRLTKRLPAGSQILGLPEGYAILRRQYARDSRGAYARLRSAQFYVVRDQPAVSPLEVLGAEWPKAGRKTGVSPSPLALNAEGRTAWDELLARVAARAAAVGRPQRVVVTDNGDVEQVTTADASGHLDTRPGSPALEFGDGITGGEGQSRVIPTRSALPLEGSIPAVVWVADTYRVGPPPVVLGDLVTPLPARVRRSLVPRASGPIDLSSVRRAVVADGPDGQWSIWNYALMSGSVESLVLGPKPGDGFGFTCTQTTKISDCGGSDGFQVFSVPMATRTLRFTSSSGVVRNAGAANGWAIVLGPRVTRSTPPSAAVAEALDQSGRILASQQARFSLP